MTDTTTKLIELAVKRFGGDASAIKPEDDIFEKLGIDSFQSVELMSELELQFDVEVPDYELQGVRTFGALAATIEKRL